MYVNIRSSCFYFPQQKPIFLYGMKNWEGYKIIFVQHLPTHKPYCKEVAWNIDDTC